MQDSALPTPGLEGEGWAPLSRSRAAPHAFSTDCGHCRLPRTTRRGPPPAHYPATPGTCGGAPEAGSVVGAPGNPAPTLGVQRVDVQGSGVGVWGSHIGLNSGQHCGLGKSIDHTPQAFQAPLEGNSLTKTSGLRDCLGTSWLQAPTMRVST